MSSRKRPASGTSAAASTSGSFSNTSTTSAYIAGGADRVLDGRTTARSVKRTSSSERPLALRSEPGLVALPARRFRGKPPGRACGPEGSYSINRLEAAGRPARTGAIPGRSACGRGAPAHLGLASGRRRGRRPASGAASAGSGPRADEPASHLHARAVEQARDIRHDHPGRRIRIRLQRFLIRCGPPLAQADIRPRGAPPGRCQALAWPRETDLLVIRGTGGTVGQ